MSQTSADDEPRTPSSRPVSTGILDTFRNLVRTRSRQSILQSPSHVNISSPISLAASDTIEERLPIDALPSIFPETEISNGLDHPRPLADECLEGPPDLQKLVARLDDTHAQTDRVEAAIAIAKILKDYPVTAVTAIWATARDILDDRDTPGAIQAGYDLLIACVRYKTLTPQERMFFFQSISTDRDKEDFSLRFNVLVELCTHGRYLESLEHDIGPLLIKMLESRFVAAAAARKKHKSTTRAVSETENLDRVLQLILDVIKFNAKVFTEEQLRLLLGVTVWICTKTNTESDITQSIDILDAIVTYSYVPETALRDCVELLCTVHCQLDNLKNQSWIALCNLLRSHLDLSTLSTLLDILKAPAHIEDFPSYTVRGAVQLLHAILRSSKEENLPQPLVTDTLSALKICVNIKSSKIVQDVLKVLLDYFVSDDAFDTVMEDATWPDFTSVLENCTTRLPRSVTKEQTAVSSESPIQTPETRPTEPKEALGNFDDLSGIVNSLSSRPSDKLKPNHKLSIVKVLMSISKWIDDASAQRVLDLHEELHLLDATNVDWFTNCQNLRSALLDDHSRSSTIRMKTLNSLLEACYLGEALDIQDVRNLTKALLTSIADEPDIKVVTLLTEEAVRVATNSPDENEFEAILDFLHTPLLKQASTPSSSVLTIGYDTALLGNTTNAVLAVGLVRIFLRSMNVSADRAIRLYTIMIQISASDAAPVDARLVIMRLLSRLRGDINHAIYVTPTTDSESLAAVLYRTEESLSIKSPDVESPVLRQTKTDDQTIARRPKSASNSTGDLIRSASTKRQPVNKTRRIQRPTQLWAYPGPKGLPEDPPWLAGRLLFSSLPNPRLEHSSANEVKLLNVSSWLDLTISILSGDVALRKAEEKGTESQTTELSASQWEVYSYVVVHVCSQLANHSLFDDAIPQIKALRSLVVDQLKLNTFPIPPAWTSLKRTDVAVCLFNILTALISYHEHFSKTEEDEIIRVLIIGVGGFQKTAEVCIDALSICCYEMPLSVSKSLESILQRMSQIITQSQTAVHILEFLAGLARLPDVFRNFRDEEFRMVFGICFRYLQNVRDQQEEATHNSKKASHQSARRSTLVSDPERRIQDRPEKLSWIAKSLIYKNGSGEEIMDEQSQVLVDMMHRVSYSDRDETVPNPDFAGTADGIVEKRNWIVGLSLLTIETAGRTGLSQITRRRPSGTRYSIFRPQLVDPPRHQEPVSIGLASDNFYSDSYVGVYPESILQEIYSPLNISPFISHVDYPTPLPNDDATQRALNSFDRTSALDGHKIGIIYVGEDQTDEASILSNVMGSADFTAFLNGIGTLIRLKGATFNTQGLDREFDTDGEFTFCWRDRVSEIVFHIPTMMPTNLEQDPYCTSKKRHTGNDFVNIIFNNSGLPFAFDTFPSDFNYVNIVITPDARASFIETRLHAAAASTPLVYKVHVQTAPALPAISAAAEPKTISAKSLPAFVRHLALNASVFAQVWAVREGGEHVSSWRTRLREIVKLRERHCAPPEPPSGGGSGTAMSSTGIGLPMNVLGSPIMGAQNEGRERDGLRDTSRDLKSLRRSSGAFLGGGSVTGDSNASARTAPSPLGMVEQEPGSAKD